MKIQSGLLSGTRNVTFPEDVRLGEYSGRMISVWYIHGDVFAGSFIGPRLEGYAEELALREFEPEVSDRY